MIVEDIFILTICNLFLGQLTKKYLPIVMTTPKVLTIVLTVTAVNNLILSKLLKPK
ncbi:hypothetical protein PBCV1_a591L [Paramecium bursaria Chlorella virus 1]|uniref:Uncharacterized protein n=1 Tax=Paramecium bursaria Chlorella virus 1 TaxID=10506 RepID=O41073_PBCV1|nr:hypothetical protein PBCV1_a591L [Paramecium bursaria Chlorella virus 1]AAC97016.2 hypothetical protein [Paramecium bursaria Chlorella virus 1]